MSNDKQREAFETTLRAAAKVYLGVVAALGERVPGESFGYFEASPSKNAEAYNRWMALNEAGKVLKAAIAESEALAQRHEPPTACPVCWATTPCQHSNPSLASPVREQAADENTNEEEHYHAKD